MTTIVRIPAPLRAFTGGADQLAARGATVGEVLAQIGHDHEGLLERIVDEEGRVRPFVNLFLGDRNVSSIEGLDTPLSGGEVISIIPAVAGGVAAAGASGVGGGSGGARVTPGSVARCTEGASR